jgi:hypothetical protein
MNDREHLSTMMIPCTDDDLAVEGGSPLGEAVGGFLHQMYNFASYYAERSVATQGYCYWDVIG